MVFVRSACYVYHAGDAKHPTMAVNAIPKPGEICLIPQAVWIGISVKYSSVNCKAKTWNSLSFLKTDFCYCSTRQKETSSVVGPSQ